MSTEKTPTGYVTAGPGQVRCVACGTVLFDSTLARKLHEMTDAHRDGIEKREQRARRRIVQRPTS
jgi:hypothetical protein